MLRMRRSESYEINSKLLKHKFTQKLRVSTGLRAIANYTTRNVLKHLTYVCSALFFDSDEAINGCLDVPSNRHI